MNDDILIGIVLLAIAVGLIFIGRPNKAGVHRASCSSTQHWFSFRPSSLCSLQALSSDAGAGGGRKKRHLNITKRSPAEVSETMTPDAIASMQQIYRIPT